MKNVVNYYYNLFPDDIHQKNKKFYFEKDNIKYIFMQYYEDFNKLEKIKNISKQLDYYQIKYNQIMENTSGSLLTYVSNSPYILIKININDTNPIILIDIINFYRHTKHIIKTPIDIEGLSHRWMDKVDYFEYQINQFGIKYPIIRHSFNYFIGMAENAISLINTISKKEIAGTISHYRVSINDKITDLYNPLNFIIDNKVRDICEYFKEKMFFLNIQEEIMYYFNYNFLTNDEAILFLSRILFPTYYFDVCEKIIEIKDEWYLKILISKINIFEDNMKFIYKFLKNNYEIPEIEWLII